MHSLFLGVETLMVLETVRLGSQGLPAHLLLLMMERRQLSSMMLYVDLIDVSPSEPEPSAVVYKVTTVDDGKKQAEQHDAVIQR